MSVETIGKYEIRGRLGAGAMGQVLDAFDPVIERRAALKLFPKPAADDAEGAENLARFKREAQAAGRLNHPNLVAVYDYGEDATRAWIAMELVEGGTLKQALDRGERLRTPRILHLMEQVLAGLDYSHKRGVVHRDIKPANVMLTEDGTAKIADFGIARIENSSMTQLGTVMGTPSYMAPEQLRGEAVDQRADIWACGVLLYQLLTGEKPFDGGFSALLHKAVHTEPPPPSTLSVTAPRGMDAVVARALAKRPEDRFPTAADFAAAMRAAVAAPPDADATIVAPRPAAPPAKPARNRALPVIGGGAALAAAGVAAFILLQPRPADPPVELALSQPSATSPSEPPPSGNATAPQVAPSAPAAPPPQDMAPAPTPVVVPAPSAPTLTPASPAPAVPALLPAAPAVPAPALQPVAPSSPTQSPPAATPAETPPTRAQAPDPAPTAPTPIVAPAAPSSPPARPTFLPSAPELTAPAPPAPRPVESQQLALVTPPRLDFRAAAAAAAAAPSCGLLAASATDSGLSIEGVVRATEADSVRRSLSQRSIPAAATSLALQGFDGPFCPALDLLRPLLAAVGAAPRAALLAPSPLRDGDLLRFEVAMPAWPGLLHVAYLMQSGEVAHLVTGAAHPAGATIRLGDPRTGFPGWEVSEPFGTDLLVAIVSDGPLFTAPRPTVEPQAAFLLALGDAVRAARSAGRQVVARPLVVETAPK